MFGRILAAMFEASRMLADLRHSGPPGATRARATMPFECAWLISILISRTAPAGRLPAARCYGRGVLAVFFLAFALAMDALALSLVRGCASGHQLKEALKCGATFGLAQGLMPLVGWSLGLAFAGSFQSVDHWIAFLLLSALGAMMLKAGFTADREPAGLQSALSMLGLAVAAFATSIDAAAAGITLPLLGVAIPAACLVIGATTGVLCTVGYLIGARISPLAGKWAERLGGLVLIVLGIRILVQHLGH